MIASFNIVTHPVIVHYIKAQLKVSSMLSMYSNNNGFNISAVKSSDFRLETNYPNQKYKTTQVIYGEQFTPVTHQVMSPELVTI